MSIYQKIAKIGLNYFSKATLFKYGFNLSPMYKRSTGKIITVSEDLLNITIKIPLSYKNRNYVNSIFGGSLFAAVDPIPMIQLMNIIGDDYVIWDKHAEIFFKRPAKEDVYAEFTYEQEELEDIKNRVIRENEIEIIKTTRVTNSNKSIIFCEVKKTIYVANKSFYKEKIKRRKIKV